MVAATTLVCTPLALCVHQKEYLPLVALALCALGTFSLQHATALAGALLAGALLGSAYGATNAYGTGALWEYFYGTGDAARIKHLSVAITTAAAGLAIWLYGMAWQHSATAAATASAASGAQSERYSGPLLASTLIALALCLADALSLAKPEVLERVVRRAPTWEQLLAFRQRATYFSIVRRARNGVGGLWRALRGRDGSAAAEARGTAGLNPRRTAFHASAAWDEHSITEMANQANPIEMSLKLPEDE